MGSASFRNSLSTLHTIILVITTHIMPQYAQPNTTSNPTTTVGTPLTTAFMTTPALTVDPIVPPFLQTAMDNRMNITQEYCLWNVTRMIQLINETDPTFLYSPQTKALLLDSGYLPQYIIRQFPPKLLQFYDLNYTEPLTEECGSTPIGTMPALELDFCVGPLVHTDLVNPVNEDAEVRSISLKNITGLDMFINASLQDCGLACKEGGKIYGLTDDEQHVVDLCKIIGVTLCFVAMMFLVINQYMDQKKTGKKFANKPLLQIIPYLITLSLFAIAFLMTIGEIIGKESILCFDNDYINDGDDKRKDFSFFNPTLGHNPSCTIHGIFFYGSLLMYQCYTVLLSFVIFRQLYAPMRPLYGLQQKYFHILIWIFILFMISGALISSSFGGVWPMGVCLPGPSMNQYLFIFVNLPFILSTLSSLLLLFLSAYYLKKELNKQQRVTNKDSTTKIQDLLYRLIYYSIGVELCLILLTITAMEFFFKSEPLSDDMNKIIQCQITQILLDPEIICPPREIKVHPFFFISWIISAILGVTAQIILSCHNEARDRLKRAATLKDVDLGSKLGSLKDKISRDKSHKSKSKSKEKNNNNQTDKLTIDSTSPPDSPINHGTITITPMPFTGGSHETLERINSGSIEEEDENENNGKIELITVTQNNAENHKSGLGLGSVVKDSMIPVQSEDDDITITPHSMQ